MIEVEARLAELKAMGLERRTRMISGPQGPHVLLDGKPVLLLCSNNYLGLADHPQVREAAADAAMRWGVGAGASRLVSGTMTIHRRLEERLAAFKGREAALLFGSGYMANSGVIAALARPGDVVFSDELNHASIIDGCRLSRAEVFVYDHCDVEHLAWGIEQAQGRGTLIVTDSVFSMDGDVAPLEDIVDVAQHHGLRVVVDEAHATGTLGPDGRGALVELGLEDQVDVIVGTLGKALGAYGAFVACDRQMARYLINAARTFIFSTAPAPPAVAGALAALELLQTRPRLVTRLTGNSAALIDALRREGFDTGASETHIVPLVLGDAALTVRVCEAALKRGVFAQAIRPPTVPDGTSRLRLAVMASHRPDELREAASTLAAAARAEGLEPSATQAYASAPADDTAAEPHRDPARRRLRHRSPGARRPRRIAAPRVCVLRGCFVTGTDTGVGKSVLSAALVAALRARGIRVRALKPVVTGLDEPPEAPWPYDHELLAMLAGTTPGEVVVKAYGPAVSPHLAQELAGEELDPADLRRAIAHARASGDAVVVEGVGGLLVPLAPGYDVRGLAADTGLPVLIAARPGLGTINHTLLTLEAARAVGLQIAGVVLTPWPDDPTTLERSNQQTIEQLGGVPVGTLPRVDGPVPDKLAAAADQLPLEEWLH